MHVLQWSGSHGGLFYHANSRCFNYFHHKIQEIRRPCLRALQENEHFNVGQIWKTLLQNNRIRLLTEGIPTRTLENIVER